MQLHFSSGPDAAAPDASAQRKRPADMAQVPYEAAGSVLPLKLLDMLKQTRAIHKLFGPDSAKELDNENAYHHAGMEYRLDDHKLIEAAAQIGHGPLRRWVEDVSAKIFTHLLDGATKIEHLDQLTQVAQYHDFQAVLCQLDAGSARRTRGMQGPLGVPDNVPNPLMDKHGTASS